MVTGTRHHSLKYSSLHTRHNVVVPEHNDPGTNAIPLQDHYLAEKRHLTLHSLKLCSPTNQEAALHL